MILHELQFGLGSGGLNFFLYLDINNITINRKYIILSKLLWSIETILMKRN